LQSHETKARKIIDTEKLSVITVYTPEFNVGSNHRIELTDDMEVSVWKYSRMSAADAYRNPEN